MLKGHANADEFGKDIVCAAVSVLTQTVLLSVMQELGRKLPYRMSEGSLSFFLPQELSEQERIKTDVLMNALVLGIKNLKEGYSEFIDITEEEV